LHLRVVIGTGPVSAPRVARDQVQVLRRCLNLDIAGLGRQSERIVIRSCVVESSRSPVRRHVLIPANALVHINTHI